MKSKGIHDIEVRMENTEPGSFRYKILEAAKGFKSSWIELGQYLFTVYKDKLYKDWGYLTFEAYCAKEVGIRQNTAVKMLKSYSFLEREEPEFLKDDFKERKPSQIPSYESVNALRLAKESERIPAKQYEELRDEVLDDVKEEGEIKKKIRYILKASPRDKSGDEDDEEAKDKKKAAVMKRLLVSLENAKNDLSLLDIPAKLNDKIDSLIEMLTDYRLK
jgi:hypothetical protein